MASSDSWFQDKHAIVGFGDFAHDIGEAGVALWGAELEGADEGGEADAAYRDWALAGVRVAGVEAIEFDEEALGGALEVVADDVEAHAVVRVESWL